MANANNDLSFVTTINITTIQSREELDRLVSQKKVSNEPLEDYDLSEIDPSQINFDGLTIENVVFSRYRNDLEPRNLSLLSFKGATLKNVSFAHSELIRCNFDDAVLQKVDFFFSNLHYCRFRKANGYCLDFRYSQINNCSISEVTMVFCDFYMTNIRGSTSFHRSHIMLSSLTSATFEESCMTMDNLKFVSDSLNNKQYDGLEPILAKKHKDVYLVQDDFIIYNKFRNIDDRWLEKNDTLRCSLFPG